MRILLLVGTVFSLLLVFPKIVQANITDDAYRRVGEQMMDQMMGGVHEEADKNIEEMMGKDFLEKMHIAMGKMAERNISGNTGFGMMPMMSMMIGSAGSQVGGGGFNMMGGNFSMMGGSGFWLFGLLAWLTWILIVIALILATIWLFKQIKASDKNKKQ